MCHDLIFRWLGGGVFQLPFTPDPGTPGLRAPPSPPSDRGSPPPASPHASATLPSSHSSPRGPASPAAHTSPKDPVSSVPPASHTPNASPNHSPLRSPRPPRSSDAGSPPRLSTPFEFPEEGFELFGDEHIVEEEIMRDVFDKGYYYPVHIGDVYDDRFQVVGKLGFGRSATVWLALDLVADTYVTLKIYTIDPRFDPSHEVNTCQALSQGDSSHPGYMRLRSGLGTFLIPRPDGGPDHLVLIQVPMWESLGHLISRNPAGRLTPELLRPTLQMLFEALDYLHAECRLVHTDIKADNILHALADPRLLDDFVRGELEEPSPRKTLEDGRAVYLSRRFGLPREWGGVVLSDFGSAFDGEVMQCRDVQPDVYRSPEMMLGTGWSYPVDIWNVGAMIWDLFEGKHLFHGQDPDGKGYSTRAHLAEAIALLGLPPKDLLEKGDRTDEFFTEDGQWKVEDIPIRTDYTLESSEENFEGEEKKAFLDFMRCMLAWRPEDRMTAGELARHPWLHGDSTSSRSSPHRSRINA